MMGALLKEPLDISFASINDPRLNRTKKYPLEEVLFIPIFAAFCGIESWRGMELLANEKIDYLKTFFPFKNGIPNHQTIGRVLSLLKPAAFESFFMKFTAELNGTNEGKQIAIDGKTVRGSANKNIGQKPIHLLNAVAVDTGLVLGQLEVGAKTNEIKTVPQMLDMLDIKGAMISVDALNTQKDIAEQIIDAKADYTLALKGNHKNLNEKTKELFEHQNEQKNITTVNQVEKKNGRVTEREFSILPVNSNNLPESIFWKGLESIGKVVTTVFRNNQQTSEARYYLLSYLDSNVFAKSARGHWAVESMHWTLDVTFGEDASTKRKDHAPRNYSLIRKFVLNIMRTLKDKLSIPLMQTKAVANQDFLTILLEKASFKQSRII